MAVKPYYEDAASGITIYHGDCRAVLPSLEATALITDPPYGVEFDGKTTKHTRQRGVGTYRDDAAEWRAVVLEAVVMALAKVDRAAIFTGTRMLHDYPKPVDIGGIVCPNGGGISSWGFHCFHPVLFYGSRPTIGAYPNVTVMYHPGMHVTGEQSEHPCPKPIAFMHWALDVASRSSDLVLDPFMGSGTTLRAAKDLGRRAIGIEIEERYCEIAAKRLQQGVLLTEATA